MDISKTAFKEYTRCPRIFPLEQLYLFRLNSDIRLFDDEEKTEAREILRLMFDEETGDDLLEVSNEQMEIMLPYYRDVEKWALKIASETFCFPFLTLKKPRTKPALPLKVKTIAIILT